MPTTKKTSSKPVTSAPVAPKKTSESHVPTAAVVWIAIVAIVFSFSGITLSAMAKMDPQQRPTQAYNLKVEIKNIVDRLDRIEKKIDAMNKTTATSTN